MRDDARVVETKPAKASTDMSQIDKDDAPTTPEELAKWMDQTPDGTLIAGATDVGLWVTKEFRRLGPVAFLNRIPSLAGIKVTKTVIRIGAATTLTALHDAIVPHHRSFAEPVSYTHLTLPTTPYV